MVSQNNTKDVAEKLVMLKHEFARTYNGNSHIQEILPTPTSNFPAEQEHLRHLHVFAKHNPIYHNFFEQQILGISCVVYEGDINSYWLNSTKHGSSCQPFYPTWILSAHVIALHARNIGCGHLVDIGSGDGRIAYCGRMLGLESYSIEIDGDLAELQSKLAESTGADFVTSCSDATIFDYAEMGGDMLAESVIEKVFQDETLKKNTTFVFAGSYSKRMLSGSTKNGGWDQLIERYDLKVLDTMLLPTIWTFDQRYDTPYIFAKSI